MKFKKSKLRGLRLLLIPAFAMALVACGGGTGGDGDLDGDDLDVLTTDPNGDADGDGIPNFEDVDLTGGADADFDGVDDAFQGAVVDNGDLDNDGILDFEDVDQTGGTDANFNGIDDAFEGDVAAPVDAVCDGSTNGSTDTDSSTSDWGDNCQLFVGGSHEESSYTRGVQRVLNCLGHPVIDDADFGPNTESAVQAFQAENPPLTADGVVGPGTWGALQDVLEQLQFDANFDAFSVGPYDPDLDGIDNRTPGCEGSILFYRNVNDGSWLMAEEPASTVMVPFSTGF